jgi:hypothetical protein
MANPNAKARVQRKYEAQYRDPIQVKAGESVEVGRADNDDPALVSCHGLPRRMRTRRIAFRAGSPGGHAGNYSAKRKLAEAVVEYQSAVGLEKDIAET